MSPIASPGMTTATPAPVPARHIDVPGIKNLRDVGGLATLDGHVVAEGRVFRSAQLGVDDPETIAGLAELGLHSVFDLRTLDETVMLPDVVPDGVQLLHLDVLAEATESITSQFEELFNNPAQASEILGRGSVRSHYLSSYRHLVNLGSARASYRLLFTEIANGSVSLFHCTAGKDRTGWAAASLQLLLNVPVHAVEADYLASNRPAMELFAPILDFFRDAGGDPDLLAPVFQVDADYLATAIAEMTELFGDIEGYFKDGLDLDREAIEAIRANLLLPG